MTRFESIRPLRHPTHRGTPWPRMLAGNFAGRLRLAVLLLVILLDWTVLSSGTSHAQGNSRAVPRANYYLALQMFNEGKFASALEGFQQAGGSGIRSTQGRWVDSICYYAMVGECYYQLGDTPRALAAFEGALELVVAHRDWMLRVKFPPGLDRDRRRIQPPIAWASSSRQTVKARFAETMLSMQGDPNVERAVRQGGVIKPPELFPLNVAEVVRCSALALRRRAEIMGPVCRYAPLTQQLVAALSRRPAPPNHWSQSWVGVLLGLAYASDGQFVQAINELRQSLVMGGQYEHGLTGIALLELGKLATRQGNLPVAAEYFREATVSAAAFEQYGVAAEAFEAAAANHLVRGEAGPLPMLAGAMGFAGRKSRWLEATLLSGLAEQYTSVRDPQRAAELVSQARRNLGRAPTRLSIRLQFQQALIAYQGGDPSAGDTALAAAMALQREASLRLFQINLADKLCLAGTVSPRSAEQLYADVLREPTADDWSFEPLDSLAVLMTPHPLPFEHWFEVALLRKEPDLALEIADLARRHRFHGTLPMGGRLLSLRWLLEAPTAALSDEATLRRRDVLAKNPQYAQLSRQAEGLHGQLNAAPLVADNAEARSRQEELFRSLGLTGTGRELLLREIAIGRQPAPLVFPPRRELKDLRQALPPGHLVLAYFATSRGMYGFAFGREGYEHWLVEEPRKLRAEIVKLLREMGHYEKNVALGEDELADESWKVTAAALLKRLTGDRQNDLLNGVRELVVVPDGPLWYLPFAALPLPGGQGSDAAPLITRIRVRTVPTVSLVLPDGRGDNPLASTAIVAGQLLPQEPDGFGAAAAAEIRRALPASQVLADPLPAPSSLLATCVGRLVVFDSLDDLDRGPYDWSPLSVDRGKPGSTLGSWQALPWGGPDQVILPGYHTAAEAALKRGGSGQEVFLSVCGLMATGSRTLLLSRWRVGGQSCLDLVREFTQELPHAPAAAAWQRSVLLAMRNPLDPQAEPRLESFRSPRSPRTDHPFFWSGYLLVDTGNVPGPADAQD